LAYAVMLVNGKFSNIVRRDFMVIADLFLIQDANKIIDGITDTIRRWREFADEAKLPLEEQLRVEADFKYI